MNINSITSLKSKIETEELLEGYWKLDVWKIKDFPYKDCLGNVSDRKAVSFSYIKNIYIKAEVKYYSSFGLKNEWWKMSSFIYCTYPYIKLIVLFLEKEYPKIKSLTEISYEEIQLKYKQYLVLSGKPLVRLRKGRERTSIYINTLKAFYLFLVDFYDKRPEYEKDRWNVEKLGIIYNMSRRDKYINFENIKKPFRELVKKYMHQNLLIQQKITYATAQNILKKMYLFFDFIVKEFPDWKDLNNLNRKNVEDFLLYVRNAEMGGKKLCKK